MENPAKRHTLLTRLRKRGNKKHRDHVAHILLVGQCAPGYEEATENLERMTEEEALEVFVCMARRSARWDRAYRRGDDPFGEVQQFLDRMPADRMAGQKMDLFRRLALEAFDELERRFSENTGVERLKLVSPVVATNGLPGHVAGTSALPLTADLQAAMSASPPISSASPPAPDVGSTPGECRMLTQVV